MTTQTRAGRARIFALAVLMSIPLLVGSILAKPAGAVDARPTVAGLISSAVKISPSLSRLEAGLQMVPRGSVLTSAGKLRPSADLGAWARSQGYVRVTPELGDALAEGSAPDATTREWTKCYQRGNGAYVICPDGFIEVN